jgi:hypothetical protein
LTPTTKCMDCDKELIIEHGALFCTKCKQYYRLVLVKVITPLDKVLRIEIESK